MGRTEARPYHRTELFASYEEAQAPPTKLACSLEYEGGIITILLPYQGVADFLRRTNAVVPVGAESEVISDAVDLEIGRILSPRAVHHPETVPEVDLSEIMILPELCLDGDQELKTQPTIWKYDQVAPHHVTIEFHGDHEIVFRTISRRELQYGLLGDSGPVGGLHIRYPLGQKGDKFLTITEQDGPDGRPRTLLVPVQRVEAFLAEIDELVPPVLADLIAEEQAR